MEQFKRNEEGDVVEQLGVDWDEFAKINAKNAEILDAPRFIKRGGKQKGEADGKAESGSSAAGGSGDGGIDGNSPKSGQDPIQDGGQGGEGSGVSEVRERISEGTDKQE